MLVGVHSSYFSSLCLRREKLSLHLGKKRFGSYTQFSPSGGRCWRYPIHTRLLLLICTTSIFRFFRVVVLHCRRSGCHIVSLDTWGACFASWVWVSGTPPEKKGSTCPCEENEKAQHLRLRNSNGVVGVGSGNREYRVSGCRNMWYRNAGYRNSGYRNPGYPCP